MLQQTDLEHPVTICSSEGGLFEYGSDDEIMSNLKALRSQPDVVAVAGSVTRADEPTQQLRQATSFENSSARVGGLPKSHPPHRLESRSSH
jgi:hypothetical protein